MEVKNVTPSNEQQHAYVEALTGVSIKQELTRDEMREIIDTLNLTLLQSKDKIHAKVYELAWKEGVKAAEKCIPTPMVVQQHESCFDDNSPVVKSWNVPSGVCGFAWIQVKPGNSSFARWLKKKGHARPDSYYGGVSIWIGEYGQSMELKSAHAGAMSRYLRNVLGMDMIYSMSRMD